MRLECVRLERCRGFENPWLGLQLWKALKLDELCEMLLPKGREELPWATTVEDIVKCMETRVGVANRVWVMDHGIMSEGNVAWLKEGDRQYTLGSSRADLRRFSREIAD